MRLISTFISKFTEREWVRAGQLKLASSVRGLLSSQETAYEILKALCGHLNAPIGAIYLVEENGDLVLLDGYSISGKKNATKRIGAWESILSTSLKEGKVIIHENLPDDYYKIHSGLGSVSPSHLLIAPIKIEKKPIAVIELAGLKPFLERDIRFIEHITEALGLSIIAAKSREETQDLLDESITQQEELRVSNEKLAKETKMLEESQDELKAQAKELSESHSELEAQAAEVEEQNRQLEEQKSKIQAHAEEIQSKYKEIERINKYRSEFLANMSHELRTPLNSMLILSKAFQNNEEGNLSEEQVEEASVIYNSGMDLLELINDVLDFSKIEAGKTTIIKELSSSEDLLRKLEKQFSPLGKENNVSLSAVKDHDFPDSVYIDQHRVEQILKNLLSNAFKFTKEGEVLIKFSIQDGQLAFTVKDSGIGIQENKQKEIFEAFKQEDGSIDRVYGGTGLGLSISMQLANLLSGTISLNSKKDIGSEFILLLPIEKPSKEQVQASEKVATKDTTKQPEPELMKAQVSSSKHQKTMLIIEDDKKFAQTLCGISEKQGYQALAVVSGLGAIKYLESNMPAAIILDLNLPDMSGLRVLEIIKSDPKIKHIPVHVVSANDALDGNTIKKGAIDHIIKPITLDQINSMFATIANLNSDIMKRVLLVEDDKATQLSVQKLLKRKELDLTIVGSGEEGLKKLKEQNFDCVILDLQLPDTTGFEWLEKIEKMSDLNTPPVIVYTARKLTKEESFKLEEFSGSIIIKGLHSSERLVSEVELFLHSIDKRPDSLKLNPVDDKSHVLESRKVLLVDDDMRNIYAMSKILKKQGIKVLMAENGEVALKQLQKENDVSLVIMDIMMPVMDGYEAISEIRKIPTFKTLPIIALTARSMPNERKKCMDVGATDYLSKPVDINVLLSLMRILVFDDSGSKNVDSEN